MFEDFTKFRGMLVYNLPIMPALYLKLAYYACIMLDTLARLLCLKLCQHNRPMHSYNICQSINNIAAFCLTYFSSKKTKV